MAQYTPKRGPLAGVTFPTQQAYQNSLAQTRGYTSYAAMRSQGKQRFQAPPWWQRVVTEGLGKTPPQGYERMSKAGYARHLRAVREEARTKGLDTKRPGGALARMLEWLGVRPPNSQFAVGESK